MILSPLTGSKSHTACTEHPLGSGGVSPVTRDHTAMLGSCLEHPSVMALDGPFLQHWYVLKVQPVGHQVKSESVTHSVVFYSLQPKGL